MNNGIIAILLLLALSLRAPGERRYEDLWIKKDLYAYVGVGDGPEDRWRLICRVTGTLNPTKLNLNRYLYVESSPPVVEEQLFSFSDPWGVKLVEALRACCEASRKKLKFEREFKNPDFLIRLNPTKRMIDMFLGERGDGTRLRVAEISLEGAEELAEAITRSFELEKIIDDSLQKQPDKPEMAAPRKPSD